MNDPSAGEIGGLFAGLVGLLVALGHALKWWLGWTDRKAATRSSKLDAWQHELELREQRVDAEQARINAEIRDEIAALKDDAATREERHRREIAALLGGYQIVAAELRTIKPDSPALRRADELLRSVFPIDPTLPAGMVVLLTHIPEPKSGAAEHKA